MRTCRLSLLVAGALLGSILIGSSAQESVAIFAPKPEYPIEARSKRWGGSGIVLLSVDAKKGHVVSARMLKSSGHKALDDAALNSFRQWRFRSGACAPKVEVPITFTATGLLY